MNCICTVEIKINFEFNPSCPLHYTAKAVEGKYPWTMIQSVTVQILRSGQPRSYADHEYEAILIFTIPEGQLWASKVGENIDTVKKYAQLMVHPFVEEGREWHEPWLEKLEEVEPGKWHVLIKSPYLD